MPKQVDHEQRRQEIVAATWLALEDVGLDGTTMREIALRAECTTGRLNHYFESRDAIIVAALRQVHSAAAHRMLSALDGRTGIDALRAVLLESLPLDAQRRREWKVWLAFWSRASTDDALKAENTRRYSEWRDLITSLLKSVNDWNRLDRERTTDALLAIVDGLGLQATLDPTTMTARRLEQAIDRALHEMIPRARLHPAAETLRVAKHPPSRAAR